MSSDNTVVATAPVPQTRPIFKRKRFWVILAILVSLLGLLGLIALPRRGHPASDPDAGGTQGDIITDDTFFYGQSEPVYPSRESTPR